eukprot:GDKK01077854.1.p1 GENE.GDKK01077854.1~~GDKK01077854.1.p1  ORF type:complete len:813 (+),score=203.69 GDKK01077854.1:139-2439(+)
MAECEEYSAPYFFVRPTAARFPNSATIKGKMGFPLGVVGCPLAHNAAYPIPEINTTRTPLIRCEAAKCKAYANPFMEWSDQGRSWKCPMCAHVNRVDISGPNYSVLDAYNRRADLATRPEFSHGCVEYIAPQLFISSPPSAPCYVFLIETTPQAFDSGLVYTAAQSISTVLKSGCIANEDLTRVSIIMYDVSVSVLSLNLTSNSFSIMTISDTNTPFLPATSEELLFYAKPSADLLADFFTNCLTSESFRHHVESNRESCLGAALRVAQLIANSEVGHAVCYVATPPSIGSLKTNPNRNQRTAVGTEKEVALLKPDGITSIDIGRGMYGNGGLSGKLAVSLLIAPHGNTFVDVANLAPISRLTGGDLHLYPNFNHDAHGRALYEQTYRILTRKSGNDMTLRVRCSRGWVVGRQIGPALQNSSQDGSVVVTAATVNEDQAFTTLFEFAPETQVAPEPFFTIQIAALYTRSDQVRVIRVMTKRIQTSASAEEVLASLDSAAAVHAAATVASEDALLKPSNPADPQKTLRVANGGQALALCCQRFASAATPYLMQTKGRELALYSLGALKCSAFKGDVAPDVRAAYIHRLQTAPIQFFSSVFYPRVSPLHLLEPRHGLPNDQGVIQLPEVLAPTRNSLQGGGIYLIDDSEQIILFISAGVDASETFCQGVFGQPFNVVLSKASAVGNAIGCAGSDLGTRVRAIVEALRTERAPCSPVIVVAPQGSENDAKFFQRLVLDPSPQPTSIFEQMSFETFLQKIGPSASVSRPM